jgi:uncharacterized membrane protein YoaK (UPF0700 family)
VSSSSPAAATAPAPVAAAAASLKHPLTLSLLTLTFTTGLIDAASYLGLGRVFTANMTGNVVLLGFGIAGAAGLPVVAPLISLAAFLLGAASGGVLAQRIGGRHQVYLRAALLIEFTLIATAAVLAAVIDVHPNRFSGDAIVVLLAFAMGIRNSAVRRIAVPDLTTTVLTQTLTGLASDSRLAGGTGKGTARRVSAAATMLAGAVVGALMVKTSLSLPLSCAAVIALVAGTGYAKVAQVRKPAAGLEPANRRRRP